MGPGEVKLFKEDMRQQIDDGTWDPLTDMYNMSEADRGAMRRWFTAPAGTACTTVPSLTVVPR